MKQKLLLTALWSTDSIFACIAKFQINKLVLLVDEVIKDKQKASLEQIENTFNKILKIELLNAPPYDIFEIAKVSLKYIKNNYKQFEIIINTSTGRRTQAYGMIYSTISNPHYVKEIVYVTEDNKEIILLPKLSHGLSTFKLNILRMIDENLNVEEISKKIEANKKLGKSKSMIYNHIRYLKQNGYLEEDGSITLAGQIVLSQFEMV